MKASIVDLRYKMNDVLKALDRNEEVTILYQGKEKGKIVPSGNNSTVKKVSDHPFFDSQEATNETIENVMKQLRSDRY
jgi:antitoxin (DNA-binding transcriptional repressor) of toxin-antitoxin stability system